jgi:hypothetical protein
MAPRTPPPPGQAWQDGLDLALLRRLWRRAERPGVAWPWQAQATLARHRRMVDGLPLAELLQRRAELLADGRVAWAPIVYARPAGPPGAHGPVQPPATRAGVPPAAAGPGRPPGIDHMDAARVGSPPRPVVRATAAPPSSPPATTPAAQGGMAHRVQRGPAAATPADKPIHPGPPAQRSPAGVQRAVAATPGTVLPGPAAARAARPEPPAVTRTAHAGPAVPTRPVVEPVWTAHPPGAPGLVLVTAAAPSSRAPAADAIASDHMPASLPVVRPEPGGDGDRPAPWPLDARAGRAGSAVPVVREHFVRAPGSNGARSAPAGVPGPLPLAPAPATVRGPAGIPGAPMTPSAGPAVPQPPPGPGTRAAAGAVPAARGVEADRGRGRGARPQRVVLAPVEIDRVADKVQRKLLHRLAIEAERRGTAR